MLYLHKNYNYIIKIKGLDELTSFALDFSIVKKSFFMMSPKWGSHHYCLSNIYKLSNKIPVPSATQVRGDSAINTGTLSSCDNT